MSGTDDPGTRLTLTRPSGHARPPWRETAGSGSVLALATLAVVLTGVGLWTCVRCLTAVL